MAQARELKQREYRTDVLSHPEQNVVNYGAKTRYNNNVRSNVFHNEPDPAASRQVQQKREKTFAEKPLATKVARASYQDSNIFGTKSADVGTVQASCTGPEKNIRQRDNNTFKSGVFGDATRQGPNQRTQNTFNSNIFGASTQNPVTRKHLGGDSKGTATLFGEDKSDFNQSSKNGMIQAPKTKFEPKINASAAMEAKARELHGESAQKYGYNKNSKRDGALMANGADWTNPQMECFNASPQKGGQKSLDNSKAKKYQQLQSSVFGGGYQDNAPVEYDQEAGKVAFGSAADWKTSGGMAKPCNVGASHTDTYRQRQKQLSSQVFEQTDYQGYAPLQKTNVDMNNFGHKTGVAAKGRKTDDEFKARSRGFEPVKKDYSNYNAKDNKKQFLQSVFDKPIHQGEKVQQQENSEPTSFTVPGRETKAQKQAMLASNDLVSGKSTLNHYNAVQDAPRVVDLNVADLPQNFDARELKKMSGARHVISAAVDEDNMKGVCLGTGRIQIRLNQGESLDQVQLNFTKNGYRVSEHAIDPRKKPNLTGIPKEKQGDAKDAKSAKQKFLSSQMPEAVGTSGSYQESRF